MGVGETRDQAGGAGTVLLKGGGGGTQKTFLGKGKGGGGQNVIGRLIAKESPQGRLPNKRGDTLLL